MSWNASDWLTSNWNQSPWFAPITIESQSDNQIHSGGYSSWEGDDLQRSGSRKTRDERKDDQDLIDAETEQEEIALVLWYLGIR